MGLRLVVPGVTFIHNVGTIAYVPPITSGLLGWYFIGDNEDASKRNHAPGGSDATVVGTPSYNTGYATLSSSNYFDLGFVDPVEFTLLGVGRPPLGTNACYLGSFLNSVTTYAMIYNAAALSYGGGSYWTANHQINGNTIQTDDTRFDMVVLDGQNLPSRRQRLHFPRISESETGATPSGDKVIGVRNLRIGTAYSTFTNSVAVAFAAVFDRAIADAERDEIYAHVQEMLGYRGIDI